MAALHAWCYCICVRICHFLLILFKFPMRNATNDLYVNLIKGSCNAQIQFMVWTALSYITSVDDIKDNNDLSPLSSRFSTNMREKINFLLHTSNGAYNMFDGVGLMLSFTDVCHSFRSNNNNNNNKFVIKTVIVNNCPITLIVCHFYVVTSKWRM